MNFKTKLIVMALATAGLTACGGSSNNSTPTPPPPPANRAPTDISLSANTIDENAMGATVGTLSATDPDTGNTFTFEIEGEAAIFEIDGTTLKVAADKAANYEQTTSYTVKVKVTDNGGASFSKDMTVDVNDLLDFYNFGSAIVSGESSVSYSGQTARHSLISELNHYIANGLQADIDANKFTTKQDVLDKLNSYFRTTDDQYQNNFALTFLGDDAKQKFITEVSSGSKNLMGKLAGNDASRMHKDWTDGTNFVGAAGLTPTELVDAIFDELADNVEIALSGGFRNDDATNTVITKVYISEDGLDLKQLIQKHLLMAVAFSQGTDDYLDQGLAGDNTGPDEAGKSYTELEHDYDEGFGYFGAAKDYLNYTDDEIASKGGRPEWQGKYDTDGDGSIDLKSEINFGASVNAAKRDRGSKDNANPTDFTKEAMNAFLMGRKVITDAGATALTAAQVTELEGYRDTAVLAWEKAIAATVVHYINDVSSDLSKANDDSAYSFADVAKHFSEMKAFALGLQFSPFSPFAKDQASEAQFAQMHDYMKTAPVLQAFGSNDRTAVEAYIADLKKARDILQTMYSFDAENVEKW